MNPSDAMSIERLLTDDGWLRSVIADLVDASDVDDVVQEARLTALERRPVRLDAPKAWLGVVARNLALRRRRGQKRRQQREQLAASPEALRSPAELAERVDAQRRVSQAVVQLPEPVRSAVLLRYYEGLNATAIGARLGIPAATVRTRLRRGIQELRVALEGDFGPDWRARCAVLLVPGVRAPAVVAAGSISLPGVLLMTLLPKLVLPSAAVLCATGLLWLWPRAATPVGGPGDAPDAPPAAVVSALPSPSPAARPSGAAPEGERRVVPPRPPEEPPTATLAGRVLGADGQPLPHVPVALAGMDWQGDAAAVPLGATDATGAFRCAAPAEAGVLVAADPTRMTINAFPVEGAPEEDAILIAVPAVAIAGRVFDADGQPLTDVTVRCHGGGSSSNEPLDRTTRRTLEAVHTDVEGRFVLPRVPASATIDFAWDGGLGTSRPGPSVSVTDFDVVLRDRDHAKELVGIVVDPQGRLLPDVEVRLGGVSRHTDAFGEFRVPLRRDRATLCAFAPGFAPAVLEDVDATRVAAHGAQQPLVLTLVEGELGIAGRVLGPEGEPRAGLVVSVYDPTALSMTTTVEDCVAVGGADTARPQVRTDADGAFAIDGLHQRRYTLRVYDPATFENITTEPIAAGAHGLELRMPDEPFLIDVRGRLVSRLGEPVAGARLMVAFDLRRYGVQTQSTAGLVRTSDATGAFVFERLPAAGARLAIDGDTVVATSLNLDTTPRSALDSIEVPLRCRIRIEPQPGYDRVCCVDRDGAPIPLHIITRHHRSVMPCWSARQGTSPVLVVSDAAAFAVFWDGDREVRRDALALTPTDVTVLR
ncbi:MAG: sigma-70 family RNA polymerase sigma factor [Planctomycetota bacterium]